MASRKQKNRCHISQEEGARNEEKETRKKVMKKEKKKKTREMEDLAGILIRKLGVWRLAILN